MTYEEAKQNIISCGLNMEGRACAETENIIIYALNKQISKKTKYIIERKLDGKRTYACPNCGRILIEIDGHRVQWGHESSYCEHCGQALDWE